MQKAEARAEVQSAQGSGAACLEGAPHASHRGTDLLSPGGHSHLHVQADCILTALHSVARSSERASLCMSAEAMPLIEQAVRMQQACC